jgi:hypothetical protein
MKNLTSAVGIGPSLQILRLAGGEQSGSPKPPQERREIGKHLHRFALYDWPGVEEIQRQGISKKEEPPVLGGLQPGCDPFGHFRQLRLDYHTNKESC